MNEVSIVGPLSHSAQTLHSHFLYSFCYPLAFQAEGVLSFAVSVHPAARDELRLLADDGGGYCEFMLDNNGGGQW